MRIALALVAVCMLAACGGGTTVYGRVVEPAAIPIRSFPRIWLSAGHLPEEEHILRTLSGHLAKNGRVNVRVIDLDDLEPARAGGRIPQATVVVLLELELFERTRSEWGSRPETICGIAGCYTSYRSYAYEVPVLRAHLTVTIYDGPTARVQQRVVVRAFAEGRDYESLRPTAVINLERKLRRMVDQRTVRVEAELLSVDAPEVDRAIQTIEGGDWPGGRRTLEAFVTSATFRALPAAARARALYDLGLARRFDPTTGATSADHFRAAARALSAAARLAPDDERYARALRALEEHRRRVTVVEQQRRAAEHNYRIASPRGAVPPAPPSYTRPVEPDAEPDAEPTPEPSPGPGTASETAPDSSADPGAATDPAASD